MALRSVLACLTLAAAFAPSSLTADQPRGAEAQRIRALQHKLAVEALSDLNILVSQTAEGHSVSLRDHSNSGRALPHLVLLDRLTRLSIGQRAPISDADLVHVSKMRNLKRLWIHTNSVTDKGVTHLKSIVSLQELNLSFTGVTDAGIAQLTGLQRLERLEVPHGVTDKCLRDIGKLSSLKSLGFTNARNVNGSGLNHLGSLKHLRSLNLYTTNVTSANLAHLTKFADLTSLRLPQSRANDEGMVHVSKLQSLTHLTVDNTSVTDAGLSRLAKMKQLVYLKISETPITDDGIRVVEQLVNLRSLSIQDTYVSAAAMTRIEAAIPDAKVRSIPYPRKLSPDYVAAIKRIHAHGGRVAQHVAKTRVRLGKDFTGAAEDLAVLSDIDDLYGLSIHFQPTPDHLEQLKQVSNAKGIVFYESNMSDAEVAMLRDAMPKTRIVVRKPR